MLVWIIISLVGMLLFLSQTDSFEPARTLLLTWSCKSHKNHQGEDKRFLSQSSLCSRCQIHITHSAYPGAALHKDRFVLLFAFQQFSQICSETLKLHYVIQAHQVTPTPKAFSHLSGTHCYTESVQPLLPVQMISPQIQKVSWKKNGKLFYWQLHY